MLFIIVGFRPVGVLQEINQSDVIISDWVKPRKQVEAHIVVSMRS